MGKHEGKEPEEQVGEKFSKINRKTLKSEAVAKDDAPRKEPPRKGYDGRHREQGG